MSGHLGDIAILHFIYGRHGQEVHAEWRFHLTRINIESRKNGEFHQKLLMGCGGAPKMHKSSPSFLFLKVVQDANNDLTILQVLW
jgi:hypothetical protein